MNENIIKVASKHFTIYNYTLDILSYFERNFIVEDKKTGYTKIFGKVQYNPQLAKKVYFYYNKPSEKKIIGYSGLWDYLIERPEFQILIKNYEIIDNRKHLEFDHSIFENKALRENQLKFFYLLKEKKICNAIIESPTGSGKTILFLTLIKLLDLPTLVLSYGKTNVHKNYEVAKKFFNEEDLGILSSEKKILDRKIQFSTLQSAYILERKYKLLIVDELQEAAGPTYQEFLKSNEFDFKLGFSATPLKDKLHSLKIIQFFGNIINLTDTEELIHKKILAKPYLHFIKIENSEIEKLLDGIDDLSEIKKIGIMNNEKRNKIAVELAYKKHLKNEKTLILTQLIEHGEKIQSMFLDKDLEVYFVSGKHSQKEREKKMEEFEKGDKNIIILSSIGDVGLDLPSIQNLIILSAGKSDWLTRQRAGRALRIAENKDKVNIYDFWDTSHYLLLRWSKERLKAYKKIKGIEINFI